MADGSPSPTTIAWSSLEWLALLEARLRQYPEHMIGGQVINKLTDNHSAVASQIILESVYAHYNADPQDASFFATNNMAMSAARFKEIGGFDPVFRARQPRDRDFCNRWRHCGGKMTYAPEAVVYHCHKLTFRRFCRQHFNYGRGAWEYHTRRHRRRSGRMRHDLAFHNHLLRLLKPSFSALHRQQKIAGRSAGCSRCGKPLMPRDFSGRPCQLPGAR